MSTHQRSSSDEADVPTSLKFFHQWIRCRDYRAEEADTPRVQRVKFYRIIKVRDKASKQQLQPVSF